MNMKMATAFACLVLACFANAQTVIVKSPDGLNEIRLDTEPVLSYSVYRSGVQRVAPTPLALEIEGKGTLGGSGAKVLSVREESLKGIVETPVYKKASVDESANKTTVSFDGDWRVALIARNDGVAYRFETDFPGRVKVVREQAGIVFSKADDKVYAGYCRANGGDLLQTSWESIYTTTDAASVANKGEIVYLPMVVKFNDGTAMCVTESDLLDYPGWNMKRAEGSVPSLSECMARFPVKTHHHDRNMNVVTPVPMRRIRVDERAAYIAETDGKRTYPWRVFILAPNEIGLCESDAVHALAKPAESVDFSWVKPGLSAWEWWNNWNITGVDFVSGTNTATYVHYIDFAAEHSLPYLVVDSGWANKFQLDEYNPDVDMEYLLKYAERKNVGLILWSTWPQIDGRQEEIFSRYSKLGVKGFKIDYMDRDDQLIARFLEETAKVAAKYKLIVDFHGMHKPTGLSRTYPNVLNYEGVHGLECTKWEDNTDFMRNDLLCLFTRMTAGAMDYTPGAMINMTREQFSSSMTKPGSQGTRVHQMALISLYEAPLQMLCDSPSQYRKNAECFEFMAKVPTVWDETKGIIGSMEDYAVIARRKGKEWYLSAICSWKGCEIDVPLAFLGGGKWKAEIFADGCNAHIEATDYVREFRTFSASDSVRVRMAPGGGWTARIVPLPVEGCEYVGNLKAEMPQIISKSAAHYRALDAAATPLMWNKNGKPMIPRGFDHEKRTITMDPIHGWRTGHYPGSLWLLHEATGDAFFKERAVAWTELLEPNRHLDRHHDVGFIIMCSFGNARRIMKTDKYDSIIVDAAKALSRRYSDSLGVIRSWGKVDDTKDFLVIPDNMMNLELLTAAERLSGEKRFGKVACSHATVTMKNHFRTDGGTYHVLNYSQKDGRIQEIRRGQGASCFTAWSRGQSWAIYGYTMMYRETGNRTYLDFARKVSDYAINHPNMPEDGIPYWDFGAPGEERDSSAGAVMAAGLIELSKYVDSESGRAYLAFAAKQLLSLASAAYFSEGDEVGHYLLKHGVGNKPGGSEIDTPLNYGDYYFLEALTRFKELACAK